MLRRSERDQVRELKQKLREKEAAKVQRDNEKKNAAEERKVKIDVEREDTHVDDDHSHSYAQLLNRAGARSIQAANANVQL